MQIVDDYSYVTDTYTNDIVYGGGLAATFAVMGVVYIASLIMMLLVLIGYAKIFKKYGKKGWIAFVPIYNVWTIYELYGFKGWLMFIPLVNVFVGLIAMIRMSQDFGKSVGGIILTLFFPYIMIPYYGFSKIQPAGKYASGGVNVDENQNQPVNPMSQPETNVQPMNNMVQPSMENSMNPVPTPMNSVNPAAPQPMPASEPVAMPQPMPASEPVAMPQPMNQPQQPMAPVSPAPAPMPVPEAVPTTPVVPPVAEQPVMPQPMPTPTEPVNPQNNNMNIQ